MGTTSNIVVGVQAENTIKVGSYGTAEVSAVDLGFTDGGIEVSKSSETLEVFVDQHLGKVVEVTTKEGVIIKANLPEASLANLALAFGQPTTAVASTTFNLGDQAEDGYRTVYFNVKGPSATNLKITAHKVKVKGDSTTAYKKDGVTMVPVEFHCLCDTTKTAGERMITYTYSGGDSTPPTVALSTPVDGGTVTKDTKGTVVWTIAEANPLNENTIVYGSTFMIVNTTTPGSAALVAGTISYSSVAKTVTFTPTSNWTASDTFQAIVTTGLKDSAGNALAAMKIEQFSVTA